MTKTCHSKIFYCANEDNNLNTYRIVVTEIDIHLNLEFRCGNFWEFWLNLEFRYDLQVTEFRIQSNLNFSYGVYLKLRWLNLEFSQIGISVTKLRDYLKLRWLNLEFSQIWIQLRGHLKLKWLNLEFSQNYRNWILNSIKIPRNYRIWILNSDEY